MLCALVITALVLRRQFFPPEPEPRIRTVENWRQLMIADFYRSGPKDAPVQIVEFFDYQCPFCKSVQLAVRMVKEKYDSKVSLVHVHFPLSGHQYAFQAAVAAECARKQGKFEDYHKLLFANQSRLGNIPYEKLARKVGVANLASFTECIERQKTGDIVIAGKNLANKLGLTGIPTFLINGRLVTGALSRKQLEKLVQKMLERVD